MTTKILIVDDFEPMRLVFGRMVKSQADLCLVGTAANGIEALKLVEQHSPDIVLMDVEMPIMDGIQATRAIRESYPDVAVIAMTGFEEDSHLLQQMTDAGAVVSVFKTSPLVELLRTIRAVSQTSQPSTPTA